MMIILLSSLSLFGAVLLDPEGETVDETADPTPEQEESAEGGTSPLSESTQEESAATEPNAASEDELIIGSGSVSNAATDTGSDTIVDASAEADKIAGSQQSDTIDAGAGDDVVDGRLGNDTISGGTGADNISGSEGNDVLYGGVIGGADDGATDTLGGGDGDDRIHLGNTDVASGGAGADTFVRLATTDTRALINDFDIAEDVVVIEHQSDTPPSISNQTVASDGVILELSDGSQVEFAGLTNTIDPSLISFVDTRV